MVDSDDEQFEMIGELRGDEAPPQMLFEAMEDHNLFPKLVKKYERASDYGKHEIR